MGLIAGFLYKFQELDLQFLDFRNERTMYGYIKQIKFSGDAFIHPPLFFAEKQQFCICTVFEDAGVLEMPKKIE
ncbi:MAG: hypothetical protein IKI88_05260 [Anaerotignum sp.]|nr:hypothetical protein [Anaerotignum sp.]